MIMKIQIDQVIVQPICLGTVFSHILILCSKVKQREQILYVQVSLQNGEQTKLSTVMPGVWKGYKLCKYVLKINWNLF